MEGIEKLLLEMQKGLGRLEGTMNSFMAETLRRMDVLEQSARSEKKERAAMAVSLVSCIAAIITALSRFIK